MTVVPVGGLTPAGSSRRALNLTSKEPVASVLNIATAPVFVVVSVATEPVIPETKSETDVPAGRLKRGKRCRVGV
jgi:hypothetical protein